MKKTKLFIEAVPLVDKQMSGIPHALAGLVAALAADKTIGERFEIVLIVPGERMELLNRWPGLEACSRRAIPMKFRVMNGLGRRGLLPPMDLLLGRGIYLFGNFFSWPLTRRSRSLTYVHDVCFAVHPELVQPDNQRMLAKNVPRFIRQSDYVITVSEAAKREIIDYFSVAAEQLIVLPNGVDHQLFHRYDMAEIEPAQEKYGLKDKEYFFFVGNIEPRKNLERLIQAFVRLPKGYALLMVGSDGWLNEKIFAAMDEANKNGHLVIKPKTYVDDDDVARLLSGAVAAVQPSLHEGFGMPVLNALAAQTLSVAADIPPLCEVAAEAAIYCDPQSVDSITEALTKAATITSSDKKKLTDLGFHRSQQFTWPATAKKLAGLLIKIQKDLS
ncbi:MAG TPA: glycosyltransferase family 1 protein [Candidatus Acidoferrum sp.]|nr:glycosyltransferase family 1 protein [Candidatus Acidoferrum sp.]